MTKDQEGRRPVKKGWGISWCSGSVVNWKGSQCFSISRSESYWLLMTHSSSLSNNLETRNTEHK